MRTAGTLLYDEDCGFCTRSAAWAPRLRLRAQVDSIQTSELDGVDAGRALREVPFVHDDGRVVYGHRAIAAALGTGPLPCRLLGRMLELPGVSCLAARVYAWVSDHRNQLPGGTAACETDPLRPGPGA